MLLSPCLLSSCRSLHNAATPPSRSARVADDTLCAGYRVAHSAALAGHSKPRSKLERGRVNRKGCGKKRLLTVCVCSCCCCCCCSEAARGLNFLSLSRAEMLFARPVCVAAIFSSNLPRARIQTVSGVRSTACCLPLC